MHSVDALESRRVARKAQIEEDGVVLELWRAPGHGCGNLNMISILRLVGERTCPGWIHHYSDDASDALVQTSQLPGFVSPGCGPFPEDGRGSIDHDVY